MSQNLSSAAIVIGALRVNFILANNADPDEILSSAAFHLDLHCLPKEPFRGFRIQRVSPSDEVGKMKNSIGKQCPSWSRFMLSDLYL